MEIPEGWGVSSELIPSLVVVWIFSGTTHYVKLAFVANSSNIFFFCSLTVIIQNLKKPIKMNQKNTCSKLSPVAETQILKDNGKIAVMSFVKLSKVCSTTHKIAACVCWVDVRNASSIKICCCFMHQSVVFHLESVLL